MPEARSFPPIAAKDARVLILGSMPGIKSLEAQQYYAHPQNAFWKIMAGLFDMPVETYPQRVNLIKKNKLALWDVLKSCEREGSLDSAIENEVPNDFKRFFRQHPKITHVFLNGGKAAQAFRKCHVHVPEGVTIVQLPSTSPAHAGMTFAKKMSAWNAVYRSMR